MIDWLLKKFKKKKTYIKIKDQQTTYFDVDDTLVMWPVGGQPTPGTEDDHIIINDNYDDVLVKPHKAHIESLKQHKARGHSVVVWSQGGADWAEMVVKALDLEEYVDLIVSKPTWFYDDLPASVFMAESSRFYKRDV